MTSTKHAALCDAINAAARLAEHDEWCSCSARYAYGNYHNERADASRASIDADLFLARDPVELRGHDFGLIARWRYA